MNEKRDSTQCYKTLTLFIVFESESIHSREHHFITANLSTYNANSRKSMCCHTAITDLVRPFWTPNSRSHQQQTKSYKFCTTVCGFGCGCPLPPDVFPSQIHCCLQIQASLKGLCFELYSRGHMVSNLMIASIFLSSAILSAHPFGLAPAECC